MLVARRTGADATFITLIEPHRGARSIESIKRLPVTGDESAVAVEITHADGRVDVVLVAADTGVERTVAGHTTAARIAWFTTAPDGVPTTVELE